MKSIYLDTLLLLSDSLHNRVSTHINADNWPGIFSELQAHTVTSLVAKNMVSLNLSSEDKLKFMQILGVSFKNFHAICMEQNKLLSSLTNSGIEVAILKGTAAAMYYSNPEHRTMGDIDLIVHPSNIEKTAQVLEEVGYKMITSPEDMNRHLVFMSDSRVEIEPHFKYSSSDNDEYNNILDGMIYDALSRVEVNTVSDYEVNTLPKLENGIVLLYHINHHLRGGLGLRQIIDWMMYVEKCLDNDFWESEFSIAANRIGLKKLAMVTTASCKKYLGLDSSITWCDSVTDENIVEEFMQYVMDHGNFGRKDTAGSTSTVVWRDFRNPIKGLKIAQETGKKTWNAYKKHRWLKPFAWLYQIIRWISHGFKKGIKISDINSISEKEKQERSFLERLGITRI